MSQETTQQPFSGDQPRSTNDKELVGQVLGGQAAEEMEELTGDAPIKNDPSNSLSMSAEEQVKTNESMKEKVYNAETRREQYIAIAENIGRTETWIDNVFEFNNDGSVEIIGRPEFARLGLTDFLPGIIEWTDLALLENKITSLKNIPRIVEGDAFLSDNKIKSIDVNEPVIIGRNLNLDDNPLENLSGLENFSIKGYLSLRGITATSIPEGAKIGQKIQLESSQVKLINDAKSKGYKVSVI